MLKVFQINCGSINFSLVSKLQNDFCINRLITNRERDRKLENIENCKYCNYWNPLKWIYNLKIKKSIC